MRASDRVNRVVSRRFFSFILLFLGILWISEASALSTVVSAQDLIKFLNDYRNSSDQHKQSLAANFQKKLAEAGITFTESGFFTSGEIPSASKKKTCIAELEVYGGSWSAWLDGNRTSFGFHLGSGQVGFDARFGGGFSGAASGAIHWETPLPFFCITGPNEHFDASINGQFNGRLAVNLDASLEQDGDGYYIVLGRQVMASSSGPVAGGIGVQADVDFSSSWGLGGWMLDFLVDLYRFSEPGGVSSKANQALQQKVAATNQEIRAKVDGNGQPLLPIKYKLPDIDPAVRKILDEILDAPILHNFIEQHLQEIIFYLVVNDRKALQDLFISIPACEVVKGFRANMRPLSVYTLSQGSCTAADPEGAEQSNYFTDSACTKPIDFRPTPWLNWCSTVMRIRPNIEIGNAAVWIPDADLLHSPIPSIPSQKWTIPQGTKLGITTESISDNTVPFMKQVRYREITSEGHNGSCSLEMRIYKKDVDATDLVPMLAIHGGSWKYRGAAFIAFEAQISHYTEQGFVVFAPFYRLAGDADGNFECQNAKWYEITSDVEAALDWVLRYGPFFGAKYGKVAVMGQSAGAHLAGWLITHRPSDVARGLLLYAPSDARDLIANAREGGSYPSYAPNLSILSDFFDVNVADPTIVDPNNPPDFVRQNSFHDLVRNASDSRPPVFLIHGRADVLIPSNQSVLFCNAYGGAAVDNGGGTQLRATYNCGRDGQLHLFEEGGHGLDGCLTTLTDGLCLAGSAASRALVADSLRQARTWLHGIPWIQPIESAIASSSNGNDIPANTFDGNLSSQWSATGDGQWIRYDLGFVTKVSAVAIAWGKGNERRAHFDIEVSQDAGTWQRAYSGSSSGGTLALETYFFPEVSARYVRIVGHGNTQDQSIAITEVKIYEYPPLHEIRLPIVLPPTTSTLKPSVALQYSNPLENSLAGIGWSLKGFSTIKRCGASVVLDGIKGGVLYDSNDRFCLDGQRLIATQGNYGENGTQYRTEQNTFASIVSHRDSGFSGSGPEYFTVTARDGTVMEYGLTEDARIEAQGKPTVRLWALNKVQNSSGDYYTITYIEDNVNGDYRPIRIDYTGNVNTGVPPSNSIRFFYEDRPDIVPFYEAGSVQKTMQRLINVQTYTNDTFVSDYRLAYDNSATEGSRLTSFTECGSGGGCLLGATFGWEANPNGGTFTVNAVRNTLGEVATQPTWGPVLPADFNGDGKMDFLINTNTPGTGWAAFLSNGDGAFTVKAVRNAQGEVATAPAWGPVLPADFNGDGKMDFLINTNTPGVGWAAFLANPLNIQLFLISSP